MGSKRNMVVLCSAAALIAALSAPARSQGYYYGPQAAATFQGQIMGGFSGTSGNTANYLQGGWAIDGGFIYWLHHGEGLGIRTDLSYSDHAATDQFLAFGQQVTGQEVDDGWGNFSAISTGPIYRAALGGWAHVYGFAQVGVSHVHLRLVQTFFAPGFYCDPFFGYCDSPDVGAASVYSYNTNRISWNVGVGLDFPSYWAQSWFIEAQYRRIDTAPHPFEYWPLMIGLRF
jgi:hypothetical protein